MFVVATLLPSELKAIGPCNKNRVHFWVVLEIRQGLCYVRHLIMLSVQMNCLIWQANAR